jgi:hypothetical protein
VSHLWWRKGGRFNKDGKDASKRDEIRTGRWGCGFKESWYVVKEGLDDYEEMGDEGEIKQEEYENRLDGYFEQYD